MVTRRGVGHNLGLGNAWDGSPSGYERSWMTVRDFRQNSFPRGDGDHAEAQVDV